MSEQIPRQSERPVRWVCPECGAWMPGPSMLCSGSFLDDDHSQNVQPVKQETP